MSARVSSRLTTKLTTCPPVIWWSLSQVVHRDRGSTPLPRVDAAYFAAVGRLSDRCSDAVRMESLSLKGTQLVWQAGRHELARGRTEKWDDAPPLTVGWIEQPLMA